MTRRAALLIAPVATVLVLTGGVALAASVRCGGGECRGTSKADELLGTAQRDVMRSFGGNGSVYAFYRQRDPGVDRVDCGMGDRDEVYIQKANTDRVVNCEEIHFAIRDGY